MGVVGKERGKEQNKQNKFHETAVKHKKYIETSSAIDKDRSTANWNSRGPSTCR